jgi:hypothetical protein
VAAPQQEREKEIVIIHHLRVVPTLLAVLSVVISASAPVSVLAPARRHIPALCLAGICVFSRRFHAGPREIPDASWSPGRRPPCFCRLRLHVPAVGAPAKLYPGRAVCLVQAGINAASLGPASLRPAIADIGIVA